MNDNQLTVTQLALLQRELEFRKEAEELKQKERFQQHQEIKEMIKGVHKRQDKTNGNVRRNTQWRYGLAGGLVLTNTLLLPLAWLITSKLIDKIL